MVEAHVEAMTTTLITGATGTIGNQLAKELLERGAHTVRVGTRRPGATAELEALGATAVALDLDDPNTLDNAFAGVDQLFLVGPQSHETFSDSVPPILAAAKRAGVSFVLRISALGANPEGGFALAKHHGLGEQYLRDSGLDFAILQPTFFQDNLVKFQGQAIAGQGAFYGASAGQKVAYVSSADIARTAAAILENPADHRGKSYVLTGPEALTDAEVATVAGEVLGKEIRYVDVPGEQIEQSMLDNGASAWMAASMKALEGVKAAGYAADVSPTVEAITGRAPEKLRSFLERHRGQFA